MLSQKHMCNCSVSGKAQDLPAGLLRVEEVAEAGKTSFRGNGTAKSCSLGFFFMTGMTGGGGMSSEDCFLPSTGAASPRFKMEES